MASSQVTGRFWPGVAGIADIGSNVSLQRWRQAVDDPLLTFALSPVERQVTKYSDRSKRLLNDKSLAEADEEASEA